MKKSSTDEFLHAFPTRQAEGSPQKGLLQVSTKTLDDELANSPAALDILFLWGRDCVNCEIAKTAMLAASERFRWPDVRWLHANVYADPDIATRFGLHGIPVFFVFRHGRKLGRITEWPGADAFVDAIEKLRGCEEGRL